MDDLYDLQFTLSSDESNLPEGSCSHAMGSLNCREIDCVEEQAITRTHASDDVHEVTLALPSTSHQNVI